MNIPTPNFTFLPSEIISDGKIVKRNLKEMNLNETWLLDELRKNGIQAVETVSMRKFKKMVLYLSINFNFYMYKKV